MEGGPEPRGSSSTSGRRDLQAWRRGGLASDVDNRIVLIPPTTAKATILDRETGQPIPEFSIRLAAAWRPGNHFIWQSSWNMDREAKKAPGAFDYTTSKQAHRYLLRVQAEGYLPEDSEPYPTDGSTHVLPFRLVKADPIRGTVRNPDGSPARGGFVYVVPAPSRRLDRFISTSGTTRSRKTIARVRSTRRSTATVGTCSRRRRRTRRGSLALTDSGRRRLIDLRAVRGEASLQLRPWARISGTVTIGGRPMANLALQSYDPEESVPTEDEPRLVRNRFVKTDAEGRFELPRVMPGRLTLVEWVPNGVNRRIWPVIRATVDVEAGRSYDLKIGASGRVVVGRLELPRTDDWMIRKTDLVRKSPKGDRPERFGVELLEEGRFRAIDLPPGEYSLRIALHEPPPGDSCGWGLARPGRIRERVHGARGGDVGRSAARTRPARIRPDRRSAACGGRPRPGLRPQGPGWPRASSSTTSGASTCCSTSGRPAWCRALPRRDARTSRRSGIVMRMTPGSSSSASSLDDQEPPPHAGMVKALNLSWRPGASGPRLPGRRRLWRHGHTSDLPHRSRWHHPRQGPPRREDERRRRRGAQALSG